MIIKSEDTASDRLIKQQLEGLNLLKLIALAVSLLGLQCGWAVQIAFTSPLFLELGVPTTLVNLVWLAGPISGLLVQPIVGVLSDRCTSKFGRRRPFIIGGTVFIVCAMLLLSNAKDLGILLGDTSSNHLNAIIIAIIGFWLLDLSNNTLAGPCRALLVDVAAPHQQSLGNSLFSFMLGFGNLSGYFIGTLNWKNYLPFMKDNLRVVFLISIFLLVICISITVFSISEPSITDASREKINPFSKLAHGIYCMPKPMIRLCVTTFFTWIGWFTFFLYITTWVAINIYQGNPTALEGSKERELFEAGVRSGALGLICNSAVSMLVSIFLPTLIKYAGIRLIYFLSLVLFALCLFGPLIIRSVHGALILIALFGIPWSVVIVFPFIIIASSIDELQTGMYLGVLNIFVVLPQLLVALGIGSILRHFGGNVDYAFMIGGISATVAAISVFFLQLSATTSLVSLGITSH